MSRDTLTLPSFIATTQTSYLNTPHPCQYQNLLHKSTILQNVVFQVGAEPRKTYQCAIQVHSTVSQVVTLQFYDRFYY